MAPNYVATLSFPVSFGAISDEQATLILEHLADVMQDALADTSLPHGAQVEDAPSTELIELRTQRPVDANIFRGIPADEVPDCDYCREHALEPTPPYNPTLPERVHAILTNYDQWSRAELRILPTIEESVLAYLADGEGSAFTAALVDNVVKPALARQDEVRS